MSARIVLISGGGSGIGRAAARRFAREGARVAVVDIDRAKAEAAAGEIEAEGGAALALAGDAASEEDVRRMAVRCLDVLGAPDVLVNCAGICPQARLTDMTLEEWNRVLSTNLTSMFLTCRELVPHMERRGGGCIVNVASVHAVATLEGYAAYAASKGGVAAFTRALAVDYAKRGIRANAVLPGAIHTPMLEASVQSPDLPRHEIMNAWNRAQPLGRVGTAEEAAAVVVFAAHPDNSFMTGATLVADGGMTAEL